MCLSRPNPTWVTSCLVVEGNLTMRSKTIIFSLLVACLPGLFAPIPALAVPPLPSSFYGVVEVDGATVPDGTIVRGLINGETCAEGYIQIYEGSPAYSLDVPGDDTATTARDGGLEGDTVQFEVGGVLADQTGSLHPQVLRLNSLLPCASHLKSLGKMTQTALGRSWLWW